MDPIWYIFKFFNKKQQTQLFSSIWPLNLSLENGTMAAYEGFLTSIYAGKDLFRPTFFELIAQEQLNEIFQPALRFLVDIFRERIVSPTLLTLLDSWEVFYTAFRMILEGSTVLNKENWLFLFYVFFALVVWNFCVSKTAWSSWFFSARWFCHRWQLAVGAFLPQKR